MPMLKIFTNLQRANIPKDFVGKILPVLAKSVNKPVERFVVSITTDCIQSMNGDGETPLIVASLESIGHLGPVENKVIAKNVADFIERELGVDQQRISLVFYDLKATDVAKGSNLIG